MCWAVTNTSTGVSGVIAVAVQAAVMLEPGWVEGASPPFDEALVQAKSPSKGAATGGVVEVSGSGRSGVLGWAWRRSVVSLL